MKEILAEESMSETPKFQNYSQFWTYYLSQHSLPATRRWHTAGLGLALLVGGYVTASGRPLWWLFVCPVIGYSFAWYSHFFVEHNRPATEEYPFWSFISEFRMAALTILGRL